MNLKDIVAVSGLSGLYKVAAKRNDGMIITSLETGKTTFASSRIHLFTPLDSITIYLENNETTELARALAEMKKQEKELPIPDAKADSKELRAYFKKILPNHDAEKVYVSDIVKIVKWYKLLDSKGLLEATSEPVQQEADNPSAQENQQQEKKEDKPAPEVKLATKEIPKAKASSGKTSKSGAGVAAKPAAKKLTNQSKKGGS